MRLREDYWLTCAEVSDMLQAARLGGTVKTVRRWLREGRLRGVRLPSTKLGWRVLEAEVDRFIRDAYHG